METVQQKNRIILLWPDGAPTSNGLAGVELEDAPNAISNISNPSLLVYPATKPNGKAILMCPGGGLSKISIGHEGRDMAAWFNAQGITYAVLKYRMPNGHREVPLDDVRQGLRILRITRKSGRLRRSVSWVPPLAVISPGIPQYSG